MTAGVAAGDFDGDGLVDLFFTRMDAADILYRNTGSGFEDMSAAPASPMSLPTNGVAAGDIDNDGDLDLYVMGSQSPRHYLYINDGTGHFTEDAIARGADVSSGAGDAQSSGHGRRVRRLRRRRLSRHDDFRPQPADVIQRFATVAKFGSGESGPL